MTNYTKCMFSNNAQHDIVIENDGFVLRNLGIIHSAHMNNILQQNEREP